MKLELIMLREKAVPFTVRYIDLQAKPAWFLALNPRGTVPVLIADGVVLTESSAINEFLDETHPPRLLPRGSPCPLRPRPSRAGRRGAGKISADHRRLHARLQGPPYRGGPLAGGLPCNGMHVHSNCPFPGAAHMSNTSKIVLLTGATAGIGRTTALHLARQGHRVIASGRKLDELARLKAEAAGLTLDTLVLDVTSPASIAAAVDGIDQLTGGHGVDVLVNNAGYGALGPTSEIGDAEMRRQYETNVFGLMAVTRAFLPKMRERRAGRIINVSSLGGRVTLPFFGVYNSTKYALEALSDALRYELLPFGIDVALIEPGVIRTNFEATAVGNLGQFATSPYGAAIAKHEQLSKRADRLASEPIVVAKAIARAVNARRAAARYVAPRRTSALIWINAVLPTRVWDWAMRKVSFLSAATLDLGAPDGSADTHATDVHTRRTAPN